MKRKQIQRERINLNLLGRLIGSCSLYDDVNKDEAFPEATIMEFYAGINLTDLIYEKNKTKSREDLNYFEHKKNMNIFKKIDIVLQMIRQVSLIHKKNLIHRDIKIENFIFNDIGNGYRDLRLIDLGDAISLSDADNEYASTFGYVAPEIWQLPRTKHAYSKQSDYFSLGVAIAEVLTNVNYQASLRGMKQMQLQDDSMNELTPHAIYTLLFDVFFPQSLINHEDTIHLPASFDFVALANHFDMAVYNKYMRHAMHAFLLSLTRANPEERLQGTDLDLELSNLQKLYKQCISMSQSFHIIAQEILYICDALSVTGEAIDRAKIGAQFISDISNMVKDAKSEADIPKLTPNVLAEAANKCITLFARTRAESSKSPVNDAKFSEIISKSLK